MFSIHHLFIACPFARLLWMVVEFSFNLPPPTNMTNMFGNWLRGVDKLDKVQIRVGVRALLWSPWNCTNYSVLNKIENFNLL